nr:exopolysaccharide biosynthesis protein [uncultured Rhodoferax sp.]
MLPQPAPKHPHPTAQPSACLKTKRRSQMDRIVSVHLASFGNTVGETVGQGPRQQLVWLGLLAMPLLFPIALPGMASAVGTLCLLVALGLCRGRSVQLPTWLAKRTLSLRAKAMLARMIHRVLAIFTRMGRPRMLPLSSKPARGLNGIMLGVAGLAMVVPVPVITFDNVLPALAITLISWGLRLRDGRMILAGYGVTAAAVVSVMLFWWGGALAATSLIGWASR